MGEVMDKNEKKPLKRSRIIEAARREGAVPTPPTPSPYATAEQLHQEQEDRLNASRATADPFERAKAIRRGELDHEMPMHDELTGWIARMPLTWQGSVLRALVTRMVAEPFFKDDETLHKMIDRYLAVARDPMSMLRQSVTAQDSGKEGSQ